MHIDLSGKTALVTGGSIGIGQAIALALADCGAQVALTYLSHPADEVVEIIRARGGVAQAYQVDATNSTAVTSLTATVAEGFGGHIDILVNNAGGLVQRMPIAEMGDELWHRILEVNLSSTFYCLRAVLPYMQTGWGRIINTGSVAGHHGGGTGSVAYGAAKGAIHTLTRGLAKEVASRGITVNAIAPGYIEHTPFHQSTDEQLKAGMITQTALKRPGMPEDVMGAVIFLASDLASFITGEVIEINGGIWFA
jgi:3-oxoacyl-[acyl-carrier protein] reductase